MITITRSGEGARVLSQALGMGDMRPSWIRWGVAVCWALAFSLRAFGQAAAEPGGALRVSFEKAKPVSELTVTRTALARLLPSCPWVDGRLDDPAWKGAAALKPLCRVGSAKPADIKTTVMVGYYSGYLYIAVHCDEPDPARRTAAPPRGKDRRIWDGDSVHILFDSKLERGNVKALVVNPAGAMADYRVIGRQKDVSWDLDCIAAAAATKTGWAVEAAVPREELEDPANDIIGFNIVRRRPGTEGEPYSWNPAPKAFAYGGAMGSLAFQRRVVSVHKIELGWPYVGMNEFRVWLRNETETERTVRVGVATRSGEKAMDTSRYRIKLPPRKTTACALAHRIRKAGQTDLAFAVLDHASGESLLKVTRPGLAVAESPVTLSLDKEGEGLAKRTASFRILLPSRTASKLGFVAMLRQPETFRTLGKATARVMPSRVGTIHVDTGGLAPGTYRLDVYIERDGKLFAKASAEVQVEAPGTE